MRDPGRGRHAFIDESERGGGYMIAVVQVRVGLLAGARTELRGARLRGQRRIHFTDEGDDRRRALLRVYSELCDHVGYYSISSCKHAERERARAELLRVAAKDLIAARVTRLMIESREGRDERDRAVLHAVLGRSPDLAYEHMRPYEEPLLWLPDGCAWAEGRGGSWPAHVTCDVSRWAI